MAKPNIRACERALEKKNALIGFERYHSGKLVGNYFVCKVARKDGEGDRYRQMCFVYNKNSKKLVASKLHYAHRYKVRAKK